MFNLIFNIILIIYVLFMLRFGWFINYRFKLLNLVDKWSGDDIDRGLRWEWRFDYLKSVGYFKPALMFWKTPSQFWPDKEFIKRQKEPKWKPL